MSFERVLWRLLFTALVAEVFLAADFLAGALLRAVFLAAIMVTRSGRLERQSLNNAEEYAKNNTRYSGI